MDHPEPQAAVGLKPGSTGAVWWKIFSRRRLGKWLRAFIGEHVLGLIDVCIYLLVKCDVLINYKDLVFQAEKVKITFE